MSSLTPILVGWGNTPGEVGCGSGCEVRSVGVPTHKVWVYRSQLQALGLCSHRLRLTHFPARLVATLHERLHGSIVTRFHNLARGQKVAVLKQKYAEKYSKKKC